MKRVTIIPLLFSLLFIFALSLATATTVRIGDIFSEDNVTVPLMINDVEDVASATINVSYEPSVIIVTDIGNSDFESFIPNLWYAEQGWVKMNGYNTMAGMSGAVKFAELTIAPRRSHGESSDLNIEVGTLTDSKGTPIYAEVINGSFTILSEEPNLFDTNSPQNPYPSISGTHNGTITPSQNITVHKLYTYPCAGTGGHTEYARIGNATLDVNATWNGYQGDWHNITFNRSFRLYQDETYNYTIRTGSYAQIHHSRTEIVLGGEISCTKFTDANGKVYYDRIPAIRLFFQE